MTSLISICIPTCNRPAMLVEALESCFSQTNTNFEIVIGDDSRDDASYRLIEQYVKPYREKIRYKRNNPPLGQNRNVNELFNRAQGDRLLLLHDDDLLLPTAIERLSSCWAHIPNLSAAFGKQYLIDHKGEVLLQESEGLNQGYFRVAANSGKQPSPAVPGVLRMFPNDAFMVRTELAQKIGYRSWQEVGDSCDFDFGLRFCSSATDIWFLDEYVAKYRLSNVQLSKGALLAPNSYNILRNAKLPRDAAAARKTALQMLAPGAASGFAKMGKPREALAVFLSSNYTLRDKLRLRALYHVLLIAAALVRNNAAWKSLA